MNLFRYCLNPLSFFGACALLAGGTSAGATERPNILLIIADDLGIETGSYGDSVARTPSMDALAGESLQFNTAWVTTASCSPSRGSIYTGLFPHQNGLIALSHHGYSAHEGLPTIVSAAKDAGYRTGIIGKLHIEPQSMTPWDFSYTMKIGFDMIAENRDVRSMNNMAEGFFNASTDKPFFLTVSYYDPHVPFYDQRDGLPEELHLPEDTEPFPQLGFDSEEARAWTASYYNCVARLDAGIGMLIESLEDFGHLENTVILLIGDHGAPFARTKMTVYDRGLRIPFLLHFAGADGMGQKSDYPVSTIDIFPTLAEAAGIPVPEDLPGRSLWPKVQGKGMPERKYIFGEHHAHQRHAWLPSRTVRSDRYQLIENLTPDRKRPLPAVDGSPTWRTPADGTPLTEHLAKAYKVYYNPPRFELYDLVVDPHCFVNLADCPDHQEIKDHLLETLNDWREKTDDPFLDPEYLQEQNERHKRFQAEWEAAMSK